MITRKINLENVKWPFLSSVKMLSMGVLQLSVLGKVLQADTYNLLAVVITGLMVIDTLADRGFSNTLIRYAPLPVKTLSVLYWGNIFMGLVIFSALFTCGLMLEHMFGLPEVARIVEIASVIFIIIPQGQSYRALMQHEKQFSDIAFCEIASVFVGLIITLLTLWLAPSVLCALWGYLAMASVRMLTYCFYGRKWFRPDYDFNLKAFFQLHMKH
ncbi:oligosaccharide flippase family protein [Pantoea stewartii]|uniref:oligosaccharide flippase family protein n=1 Tax=Pantoea stewartii TaxID=66269 RepID=UPI0019825C07|nr:oligosaccharide flippase family protein [Pantoea stewartii]